MLHVRIPEDWEYERRWAVSAVFESILGIEIQIHLGEPDRTEVYIPGATGKITIPDVFFAQDQGKAPIQYDRPDTKLESLDCEILDISPVLTSSTLPVLFGNSQIDTSSDDDVVVGVDIFGAAFFMLSRIEEMAGGVRDEHGRFPAAESLACKFDFLDRPIIDEYAELLWALCLDLWPGLTRPQHEFKILLSHDVDDALQDGFGPEGPLLAWVLKESWTSRRPDQTVTQALDWFARRSNNYAEDPFNAFSRMMGIAEKNNIIASYNFMSGHTLGAPDGNYDIHHPFIRRLIKSVHERGHEIGFHPSYMTVERPGMLEQEFKLLKSLCTQAGVQQSVWGGRQHYLRFDVNNTWREWAEAGLNYDSTLGYPDRIGFRCGTCHEFQGFDLQKRAPMQLRERPLIAMDTTLFSPKYMNLKNNHSSVLQHLRKLKDSCRKMKGNFCILWHNNNLTTDADLELMEQAIFL